MILALGSTTAADVDSAEVTATTRYVHKMSIEIQLILYLHCVTKTVSLLWLAVTSTDFNNFWQTR